MKKKLMLKAAVLLAAMLWLMLPVSAQDVIYDSVPLPENYDYSGQLDAIGAPELIENIPEDTQQLLYDAGITEIDYLQLLTLSPADFFATVWKLVKARIRLPLTVFGVILGVVIICALLDSMKTSLWDNSLTSVFSVVSVACIATTVASPIIDCVIQAARLVQDCAQFMLAFIPVFASVTVVSGNPATASTYTLLLFGACQVVSQIVSSVLVPLMGIYLAMCIAGGFAPGIDILSIAKAVKSVVSWALGLLMTLFVALLSMQSLVASGGDAVTSKAAKFLISSFIPVAGGPIAEAFIASQGYLKLLRTTVGVFGVLVVALTFLPVVLQSLIWYLAVNFGGAVSAMFGIKPVEQLLKSCATTLGALLSIICCFALLITISTSVVMILSSGGGG